MSSLKKIRRVCNFILNNYYLSPWELILDSCKILNLYNVFVNKLLDKIVIAKNLYDLNYWF